MADYIKSRGNIENVLIISAEDGCLWASTSPDSFYLRKYNATITQEDGSEREELVNEALNIIKFIQKLPVPQGLRLNGQRKQQITRNFTDDTTGLVVIYSKIPNGGACIAHAGKCVLIGTFNENMQHTSPECNDTIVQMAAYLKNSTWPIGNEPSSSSQPIPAGPHVSWQEHCDKALVAKGHVVEALFLRADTGDILAAHPHIFALKTYTADIAQEDGSDRNESVDERKNILQVNPS